MIRTHLIESLLRATKLKIEDTGIEVETRPENGGEERCFFKTRRGNKLTTELSKKVKPNNELGS